MAYAETIKVPKCFDINRFKNKCLGKYGGKSKLYPKCKDCPHLIKNEKQRRGKNMGNRTLFNKEVKLDYD